MKLIIRSILIAFILLLLGYLGQGIYLKIKQKELTALRTASLPDFTFQGVDSKMYSRKDVSGIPLWLIFFDTNCEYCQMEIENILDAGNFGDIRIWLVSSEPLDSLSVFAKKYKLDTLPHVQVLNDTHHAAYLTFNVTSSPASFLYGSNGSLIKQYKGVVKVETVLKDYGGAKIGQL